MQREPAPAARHEFPECRLLRLGGHQITGVGDQKITASDGVDVVIVRRNHRADRRVLGQELQQLEAGEVDVVVVAGGNQIDAGCRVPGHAPAQNWIRLVIPPSMTMLDPVVNAPSGLASSATCAATSDASPILPSGTSASVAS